MTNIREKCAVFITGIPAALTFTPTPKAADLDGDMVVSAPIGLITPLLADTGWS